MPVRLGPGLAGAVRSVWVGVRSSPVTKGQEDDSGRGGGTVKVAARGEGSGMDEGGRKKASR